MTIFLTFSFLPSAEAEAVPFMKEVCVVLLGFIESVPSIDELTMAFLLEFMAFSEQQLRVYKQAILFYQLSALLLLYC